MLCSFIYIARTSCERESISISGGYFRRYDVGKGEAMAYDTS